MPTTVKSADREASKSPRLRIQEHFVSVQGEGRWVGVPSRFIRITGCNLRCVWCDSPDSSWSPKGEWRLVEDLVRDSAAGPQHVVITGGEPLLFPETATLARRLREQGHVVTVETAGTRWLDDLEVDLLSLSPKLAHSTPWSRAPQLAVRHEQERWPRETLRRWLQSSEWQLKFVVRWQSPAELDEDIRSIQEALNDLGFAETSSLAAPSSQSTSGVEALLQRAAWASRVFLMPECIDANEIAIAYERLIPHCLRTGFSLGQRLHIQIWGHTPGT